MIIPANKKGFEKEEYADNAPQERTVHRLKGGFGEQLQKVALEPER